MKPVIAGWLSMFLCGRAVGVQFSRHGGVRRGICFAGYQPSARRHWLAVSPGPAHEPGVPQGLRPPRRACMLLPTHTLFTSLATSILSAIRHTSRLPPLRRRSSAPGNPPVIINQYFGAPDWNESVAPGAVPVGSNGNAGYSSSVPPASCLAAGVDAAPARGPRSARRKIIT